MINKLKSGHWPIFMFSSLSSFANLFLPIILVRMITPEQMGHYKIFFLYMSAIPFFFLTGGPINSVYYWVGKQSEEKKQYIEACFNLAIILSLLILVIGIPFAGYFSQILNMPVNYFLAMLVASFSWVPASFFSETSIATGKQIRGSIFATSFELIKVVGFISIASLDYELAYIFYFYAILYFIKMILNIGLSTKNNYLKFNFNKNKTIDVFKYCLPISLAGLLGFFVDKVDMLILSSYLSPENFAYYSMGCLVIPPLILLEMSVQKILIPKLSKAFTNNENSKALGDFKKAISDIAFILVPAIFGLYFFAEPIVELLYTNKYSASAAYLKIFAFSYFLYIFPHDSVPRATGKTGWILKIYLLTTPITLIAVFLAVKHATAQHALMIAIALKFLPKIAGLKYSSKIMKWNILEMIPWTRLFIFTFFSIALGYASLAAQPYFNSKLQWFFVCAPIFAVIYLGSLYYKFRNSESNSNDN